MRTARRGYTFRALALGLAALAPATALARQPADAAQEEAAKELRLDFRDAPLDAVLEYLSEAAGLAVVKVADVSGRVTVWSHQPLDVDEAVALLSSVLKEQGYTAIRTGRTLKIYTLADAQKQHVPVRAGSDPEAIATSDEVITQVIPIRHADAVRLKEDLAPLVPSYANLAAHEVSNALILTDTSANVRRIVEIIQALDTHMAAVTEVRVFSLRHAGAEDVARLINEVFEVQGTSGRGGGPQEGGGVRAFFRNMSRGRQGPEPEGGSPAGPQKVTASADTRTNTVVVSAATETMLVVAQVVADLDANPVDEQAVFTYPLRNATAAKVAEVLSGFFEQGNARSDTTGRTGGNAASSGGRGGGGGGGGGGAAQDAGGGPGGRGGFMMNLLRQQMPSGDTASSGGLTGNVQVVADEDTNALLVLTAPRNFERVKAIIAELDRAIPQVLIKVLIAEVTHDKTRDVGADFSATDLRPSTFGSSLFTDMGMAPQTGGFIYKLVEQDLTATLRALDAVGNLDVLSRPYILTSDNQTANITVGQEVPFIRNTRTTETGQTINTIEYEDIGLLLEVTPHINMEGLVILDVTPEISSVTGTTVPISETVKAPVFAKRSAKSRVAIPDGRTIVIGGLMEDKVTDTISKVPLLGDIPLLGALFRRKITQTVKTELLIFLTPHVATQADLLESLTAEERARARLVPDAVAPGRMEEYLEGMERSKTTPPGGGAER